MAKTAVSEAAYVGSIPALAAIFSYLGGMKFSILKSCEDASVNFIHKVDTDPKKAIEARFVQRDQDYFIVYLSSQTGCKQGCNMCHLTATSQTKDEDVTPDGYVAQAQAVIDLANMNLVKIGALGLVKGINVNFMARGEPLANKHIAENGSITLLAIGDAIHERFMGKAAVKFNVSTIFPRVFRGDLAQTFSPIQPTFYYSLYSMNEEFRRKWLPAAQDPRRALDAFAEYQQTTSKILKLHGAFIDGQNDSIEDLEKIVCEVNKRGLICDFNLVRYNPYSPEYGKESSPEVIERNLKFLREHLKGTAKVVSRVGFDVKASCGMFVE